MVTLPALSTKFRKLFSIAFCRSPVYVTTTRPIFSFAFDDFPRSSLLKGGLILKGFGGRATYYTAFGLESTESSLGPLFTRQDVHQAFEEGHEIGCHTFDHLDAWKSNAKQYQASIEKNADAVASAIPGFRFKTFAYPLGTVTPATKRIVKSRFECGRGGFFRVNHGKTDAAMVSSYFLDKRLAYTEDDIRAIIDSTCLMKGWTVFTTHDIEKNPSLFGCSGSFLEMVVRMCVESGAAILPVSEAFLAATGKASHQPPPLLND